MIVVDRVEGDRAVLELLGELIQVPAAILPPGAGEGSVLVLSLGDERARLDVAEARLARLRAAGPQEDEIDLSGES